MNFFISIFSTAIRHAQLLPNLPPVIFKRDLSPTKREEINHLLDTADKGPDVDEKSSMIETSTERTDLYDSDRTVLLSKLSNQSVNDVDIEEENSDIDHLSVEQLQRRMKAFALTKRMKTIEKQRSAIDGLIAIEKERKDREDFSSNKSSS